MGFYDDFKDRLTLTYMPRSTVRPVEHRFEGLTTGDVTFTLAALARRTEGRPGAVSVAEALAETRDWHEQDLAARVEDAVRSGLGGWRRLLPGRIQRRITARLMLPLVREAVDLRAEMGAMHARIDQAVKATAALQRATRPAQPANTPEKTL